MQKQHRAVVFAYSSIGYECLAELLARGVDVVAVYTHEDDPAEERWFRSVRELAEEKGLLVRSPDRLGEEEVRAIQELRPDLIFSFYYRLVIPLAILKLAPLGAFNIHGALLPRYRGRACVNWAILRGETETGVTLHHMTERVDAGRIVDQEAVSISINDTAYDVFKKMIPAAQEVLSRSLPAILTNTAQGREQDESRATYFGRRRPEDGEIDWSLPARVIYDLVRAVTHPFPGAFTYLDGKKLFIWTAKFLLEEGLEKKLEQKLEEELKEKRVTPGFVMSSRPLKVVAGSGALRIDQAQWSDGEKMKGNNIVFA
jgi:methionyl-tRNA formyltransferase